MARKLSQKELQQHRQRPGAEKFTDEELEKAISHEECLFSRVSPAQQAQEASASKHLSHSVRRIGW